MAGIASQITSTVAIYRLVSCFAFSVVILVCKDDACGRTSQAIDSEAMGGYYRCKPISFVTGWQSTFGLMCKVCAVDCVGSRNGAGSDMQQNEIRFGVTLKKYRETLRVSQSKLAERAGFDHSYVSRLESGARTPTRDAVEQLSRALELERVEQDELLASAGFLPKEISSLLSGEPEITEVLGLLQNNQVPEAYRDSMRQVLRLLADQARLVLRDEDPSPIVA